MAQDINNFIDPKLIETLEKLNQQIVLAGENIDKKLLPAIKQLESEQSKLGKTTSDSTTKKQQLTEAEKEAAKISQQLSANEKKIDDLKKGATDTLVKQKLQIQQLTQAQKDRIKAEQAAEGSLVRMRQKLKELTTEYDKAGTRTKAATKEINDLSREIGKAEAATNRHGRGVGGYADQLGNLPGALGNVTASLLATGKAMWALVANPIGAAIAAITLAVTGLFKAFKSTDEGATFLNSVFKSLGNIVDVLLDRIASFGKLLFDVITLDFKGMKENGEAAFGGIADAIRDAAVAGYEYEQQMDRISDRESASLIRAAKLRKEIEELTVASKNRNLGAKEQARLAELAIQKSIELNAIEKSYAKERTDATLKDLASKIANDKLTTESKQKQLDEWLNIDDKQLESALEKDKAFAEFYNNNEEDFKNLQKLRAQDIDNETELVTETRRLQTSLFTYQKQLSDERKKQEEETNKKIEEERKRHYEALQKEVDIFLKMDNDLQRERISQELDKNEKIKEANKTLETDKINALIEGQTERAQADINWENQQNDIKKQNEDSIKEQAKQQALELGNYLFDQKKSQLQREFEAAEGNAEKQKAISKKIAQAEKNQALFNIAMNTAVAISKVLGQTGIFGLAAWIPIAALAAVQAATVQATPIPQFAKGTSFAPGGLSVVGERGRELIQRPNGQIMLANNPALVNLERGSKVFNNRKTEAMLNDTNIVSELRQTRKAIQRMPQPIFKDGSKIGERRGNYWNSYLRTKHRLN